MTATITPPETPASSENPDPVDAPELIQVFANLLPDEVIAARRLATLKRRLALGLVGLVVVLGALYAYSWWQTSTANDDLATAQQESASMTQQLQHYAPLISAQATTAQIQAQLQSVMATDVQWAPLIQKLTDATDGKLTLTGVAGTMTPPDQVGAGAADPLNTTGLQVVGTLTLNGTTPDYKSVAAYVERLGTLKGLAVVDPGLVSGTPGSLTFTVTVSLTTDALGGRFQAPTGATTTTTAPGVK